jgi:hypothetical protein
VSVRVYVPADLQSLARFTTEGGIGPSPVHGHAVTEWLQESWPDAEQDDWEYAAMMAAADDSATALEASPDPDVPPRRVVLVAEVERVTADRESTAVSVDAAVSMRVVQAVHADTEDVDLSVPEALGDLGWFGVQEIAGLLAALPDHD